MDKYERYLLTHLLISLDDNFRAMVGVAGSVVAAWVLTANEYH